ncbi:MAG: elongator complex protein 3 [Thermodesulfobacteriota bacterium]
MKPSSEKPYVIPVFIPHSGCPHRCTYCNQKAVTGTQERMPGPQELRTEMEHWLQYRRKNRGFTEVSFFGGNFLGIEKDHVRRLLDVAADWVKAGKIDGIRFSTRPDTVDKDRLELLAGYPVSTVELGVQSMDDRVLARVKRGHSAADSASAADMLKNGGYRVGCQIMTGLPKEDENGSIRSAAAVAGLSPDFVRIYPLVVLSGSLLAAQYRKGRFQPLELKECVRRVAALYRVFSENRIPVIRMGLQASRDLNAGGAIVAGPYHPAFGHMVFSELMLEKAREVLDSAGQLPETVELRVNPSSVSRMQGLEKSNIKELEKNYPGVRRFIIRQDAGVDADDVVISF